MKKSKETSARYGLKARYYAAFAAGHQARTLIPSEKIIPMLMRLYEAHGSWTGVGAAIGVNESTTRKWRNGQPVRPKNAKRILAATREVLRGFDRHRWSELDTAPRTATEKDHLRAKQAAKAEQQINRMYGIRGNLTEREKRKRRTAMGDRYGD